MSHFAQIDENNVVQQVLVIDQAEVDTGNWGDPAAWIQTSYNTLGGVYYTPGTNTPDTDQSKAFRKNYAGIGYFWLQDGPSGEGFAPPQPYPSWTLDSFSYLWQAPVPMPDGQGQCLWDEATLEWVCDAPVTIPVYPE
jgi:hypothetical protein